MLRVLGKWATSVFRPVLVNLLTALFLFAFAVVFKTDILQLFGLDRAEGYPIVCTAEMYRADDDEGTWLDFYIINISGNNFDEREDLENLLAQKSPDPSLDLSPDISFTVSKRADSFKMTDEMINVARDFNDGKGEASTSLSDDRKTATIRIDEIGPYSVLKATLAFEGYSLVGDGRGFVALMPIKSRETVFEQCYTVRKRGALR